jgi:hypothetical protein
MALVSGFRHQSTINPRWRSETECGYSIANVDGQRVLALVTFGSKDRQLLGKGSQFLQLDESAARELVGIIREAFPSL